MEPTIIIDEPTILIDEFTASVSNASATMTKLLEATNISLQKWQTEVLKAASPKGVTLSWNTDSTVSWSTDSTAMPAYADGGYVPPKTLSPTFTYPTTAIDWTDFGLPKRRAKVEPRKISRQQVLEGFRAVVAKRGPDYIATSHQTNYSYAPTDVRCIQGELLIELGFDRDKVFPGAAANVAELIGLSSDKKVYTALEIAEFRNDMGVPWGQILAKVELCLAA